MKFKPLIGILGLSLFMLFAACVKELSDNHAAFEAEKAELLKAKSEMVKSLQPTVTSLRTVGKKYFGQPHNGLNGISKEDFLNEVESTFSRVNPNTKVNEKLRLTKVWNPKLQSLKEYMSEQNISEKVIAYSNTLKNNIENAGKNYADDISKGRLNVADMVQSIKEVYVKTENDVIEDRNLTESEKLLLLAATTTGFELIPIAADIVIDFHANRVNISESSRFWRVVGNFLITVAVIAIVATIAATVGLVAGAALIITGFVTAGEIIAALLIGSAVIGSAVTIYEAVADCNGICHFPDDGCYCQ